MPEQENKQSDSNKTQSASPKKGSNNKLIIIIAVVVGVFVVLGIASFFVLGFFAQKTAETITEQATGGKVDIEEGGDKVTIETDEGKATFGKNEVPDSFPSDITVYSGSEVTSTTVTDNTVSIILKTSDSVSTSFGFYKSDLKKNGWTEISSVTYGGSSILSSQKGDKQVVVQVTTDPSDDKTLISILVSTVSQ